MIREKSCGAVVWKKTDRGLLYLVEHMIQGHTSLPKGHVEGQETEEETAIREIREETNLEVELDTGFREVISYSPYPGCRKDVVFFTARALDGPQIPQESEVKALSWLPYEKARKALSYPSDREILDKARIFLSNP